MKPVEAVTSIAGHVSEEILLRNEYLAAENEILRSKLGKHVDLTDAERIRLAKLGKKLVRKGLEGVPTIVTPETVLRWYRELRRFHDVGADLSRGRRWRWHTRPRSGGFAMAIAQQPAEAISIHDRAAVLPAVVSGVIVRMSRH